MQCDTANQILDADEWPTLDVVKAKYPDGRAERVDEASSSGTTHKDETPKSVENNNGGKKNKFLWKQGKKINIEIPSYRKEKQSSSQNYQQTEFSKAHNTNGENSSNRFQTGLVSNKRQGRNKGNRSNYHHQDFKSTLTANEASSPEVYGSHTYVYPPLINERSRTLLKKKIREQIEYYFSEENLKCDLYLRQKMDQFGFVPVSLIETFNKVKFLTQDRSLILEALKESSKIEICKDFLLRPVINPLKWPIVYSVIRPETFQETDLPHHMSNLSVNNYYPPLMYSNFFVSYPPPHYISSDPVQNENGKDLQHLGACALPMSSVYYSVPIFNNTSPCSLSDPATSTVHNAETCSVSDPATNCNAVHNAETCSASDLDTSCNAVHNAETCSASDLDTSCSTVHNAETCSVSDPATNCNAVHNAETCSVSDPATNISGKHNSGPYRSNYLPTNSSAEQDGQNSSDYSGTSSPAELNYNDSLLHTNNVILFQNNYHSSSYSMYKIPPQKDCISDNSDTTHPDHQNSSPEPTR